MIDCSIQYHQCTDVDPANNEAPYNDGSITRALIISDG